MPHKGKAAGAAPLTDDDARRIILGYLYRRNQNARSMKGKQSGADVTISVLRADLKASHGLTVQQAVNNLNYLISQGWVEEKPLSKSYPTPKGAIFPAVTPYYVISAASIDKIGGPSEFVRDRFQGISVEATGQNIITLGNGNRVNVQFREIGESLAGLRESVKTSNMDEGTKLNVVADIDSIQDQLAKGHPNKAGRPWRRLQSRPASSTPISRVGQILQASFGRGMPVDAKPDAPLVRIILFIEDYQTNRKRTPQARTIARALGIDGKVVVEALKELRPRGFMLSKRSAKTVDTLPKRTRRAIQMRQAGKTLEEIGEEFVVTRERARQILEVARQKLKWSEDVLSGRVVCKRCGRLFKPGRYARRDLCSDCQNIRTCPACGRELSPSTTGKYCNDCRYATRPCANCGKPITRDRGRDRASFRNATWYCDRKCFGQYVGRRFGAQNLQAWRTRAQQAYEETSVEERDLIERLVKGDEAALETLVLRNRDLAGQLATRYGVSEDSVMPHLVMAAALFAPGKGRPFRKFAHDYAASMVRRERK
jgi:DNA-directed RNA polymerase specialized sigma subunit